MNPPRKSLNDIALNAGFIGIHVVSLLAFWTGVSWTAIAVCIFLYFSRMFAVTAGYHRYFSHRSYKTSRWFQFVLGVWGASAVQNGPLWWAAQHRHHHKYSDTEEDVHSPVTGSFWWAHCGWILSKKYNSFDVKAVHDLAKFPELRLLQRAYLLVPVTMGVCLYILGEYLASHAPGLHTSGAQLLIWGGFVSTTLLYHGVFTINSLAHRFGTRRFDTPDDSRNNWFLALITLGEGWHNNHHRCLSSERQGFYWWEVDIAHYVLTMFSWVGLVWDLRTPPKKIYDEAARRADARHGRGRIAAASPIPAVDEILTKGLQRPHTTPAELTSSYSPD
jgi:stearoyl-CoA desaturase (delta-9 desaturase)